jgi:hypothetical protein
MDRIIVHSETNIEIVRNGNFNDISQIRDKTHRYRAYSRLPMGFPYDWFECATLGSDDVARE